MKGCFLSSPPDFDSDDVFAVAAPIGLFIKSYRMDGPYKKLFKLSGSVSILFTYAEEIKKMIAHIIF